MPVVTLNYLAIGAAALSNMFIGYLWYGPLFAKSWMKELGKKSSDLQQGNMGMMYGLTFVGAIVQAFVLAHFVSYAAADTVALGAMTGFWAWLGLVAPVLLSLKLFENRSWTLFWINAGYYLVTLVVMGMILAGFR